ncbi:flagellar motor protein MotB [Porticoccaceae bacterium]|jgi:chemotaxis protein MotB|nr:flagellar motor protein MotB [Porticoccaceae bacterium]
MAEQDDEKRPLTPDNESTAELEEAPLPVVADDPTDPPEPPEEAEPPEEQEPAPDPDCPECKSGAPAWMATFADMATLLMAFFVLLLSFAEMNVPKYKEVSGSLKNAFGVQRLVPVVEPPKAKSIIAQQYKAARVDPTLMDVIQEQTTNLEQPIDPELKTDTKKADFATNSDVESVQNALAKEIAEGKVSVRVEDNKLIVDVASEATSGMSGTDSARNSGAKIAQNDLEVYAKIAAAQAQVASQITVEQASPDNVADSMSGESAEGKEQAIADQFKRIRMALSNEISQGLAEVERDGDKIIVRLAERGSFRSGYADLQPSFKPLLNKVGASISDAAGLITIEGHTDNVPIAFSERFRSNWDLSAARSAAVADYLLNNTDVADGRVTVTGFADTKPLASNDTPAGRSRNRRIEVIIDGG